jgi:hypothetical protein
MMLPQFASAGLMPFTVKPKQISDEDWKNAKGMRTGAKDLRLADGGHYIGGIDRVWWLVMTGPPTSKFHYHFAMLPGKGVELQGTYEVKDGLAWFSGTMTGDPTVNPMAKQNDRASPVRLALNYQIIGGKPHFNLLGKNDKGNYQYERKWFQPSAKDWIPLEHHKLTFVPTVQNEKQLKFKVKAELTRWDATGKKPDRHFFDVTAEYMFNQSHWYKSQKQPGWLPLVLRPSDGKFGKELPPSFHLHASHFGDVHGFTFGDAPKWDNQ